MRHITHTSAAAATTTTAALAHVRSGGETSVLALALSTPPIALGAHTDNSTAAPHVARADTLTL
jgi:hypothetical protein